MAFSDRIATAILLCCAVPSAAWGDDAIGLARPVIVPQVGVLQRSASPLLTMERVTATVDVRGATVTTQLDVQLKVKGKSPVLCDVLVPLPPGAELISVRPRGDGSAKERAGFEVLSGTPARNLFRRLAVNLNEPSVLEFYGSNIVLVRSLTFPGGSEQVIQARYRETSKAVVECVVPRSEWLHHAIPWGVSAAIRPKFPAVALYCPSHPVETNRATNGTWTARVPGNAAAEPGPFRLSWTTGTGGVNGLVLAYPPQKGEDGFFLWLLHATPAGTRADPVKREITLVIDRSASMDGERIRQVRDVANGVIGTLRAGEAFNIVTYNQAVDAYAKSPVTNTAANVATATTYLKNIRPQGGSNIYDALKTSLSQPVVKDRLPIVLFFTDGLPLSGSASEVRIRNLALQQNPHRRRIYAVGIGVDLLSPLLNGLASASGGQAVFVLPKEDLAKKLAPTLDRLQKPVLTDAEVAFHTADGKDARATFRHVIPAGIPDLFAGDQVVVLGRYRGKQPRTLALTGNYLGTKRTFRFPFDPQAASTAHTFLPRLWASRRIGELIATIRQEGAKAPAAYSVRVQKTDPKLAQQSKEVLELTARYGVLTEYTAFLSQAAKLTKGANTNYYSQLLSNFDSRAVRARSGIGSVSQDTNNSVQNGQFRLNSRNRYWDAKMSCVDVGTVQQIGTIALFRRDNRWVDGRLLIQPGGGDSGNFSGTTIAFGSSAYWKLLDKLSSERLQGVLAVDGDVLLLRDGRPLLVTGPKRDKTQYVPAANLKVK